MDANMDNYANDSAAVKDTANDIVIEDAFKRLEEINAILENPSTNLKDSMALYAEGVKLVAACKENLEGVEKEIRILNGV